MLGAEKMDAMGGEKMEVIGAALRIRIGSSSTSVIAGAR